jgi:hypothetical protein
MSNQFILTRIGDSTAASMECSECGYVFWHGDLCWRHSFAIGDFTRMINEHVCQDLTELFKDLSNAAE